MKFSHIINPVKVGSDHPSYLFVAQPVTYASMLNAKEMAKDDVDIELFTTQYPEDHPVLPLSGFTILSDLERSVQDVFDFNDKSKKLPLLGDIIQKLYDNSDAEYLIYTNVDIGLRPNFYQEMKKYIDQGHDAICIHRQNLKKGVKKVRLDENQMELIYQTVGERTAGHDCFVFHRSIVPKMNLKRVFLGYPPVGTAFRNVIKRHSKKFLERPSKFNLTFHLGSDRPWSKNRNKNEYAVANHREAGGLGRLQ